MRAKKYMDLIVLMTLMQTALVCWTTNSKNMPLYDKVQQVLNRDTGKIDTFLGFIFNKLPTNSIMPIRQILLSQSATFMQYNILI